MNKYIDVDDLRNAMYQETFEKDSKMQKWESGCWIRYKLFENVLDAMPIADVVEVVRCKDCKHLVEIDTDNLYVCDRIDIGMDGEPSFLNPENDFCSYGERREAGE